MEFSEDMSNDDYRVFIQEQANREAAEVLAKYESHLDGFPRGTELFRDKQCVALGGRDTAKPWLCEADKDGLCPIPRAQMHPAGYRRQGEYFLLPHPVLRRSFSVGGTINQGLISALLRLGEKYGVQPLLRFDSDALGIPESFDLALEHDYWQGPKVNGDLLQLPTDLIVHRAMEDDPLRSLNKIDRIEFYVSAADDAGVRAIKMEEVHTEPVGPERRVGFAADKIVERFIHADLAPNGTVPHLDGAFRGYSEEEWGQRTATDLKRQGRQTDYTKLFKINAPNLTQQEFAELACAFFWGNDLVGEVFERLANPFEAPSQTR